MGNSCCERRLEYNQKKQQRRALRNCSRTFGMNIRNINTNEEERKPDEFTEFNPASFVFKSYEEIDTYFKIVGVLGEGSYGKIYKAVCNISLKEFVIKEIGSSEESLLEEIQLMRSLDHPNIVKTFGFCKSYGGWQIVEEYCEGETLYDIILKKKSITEPFVMNIIHQILRGLRYCHKRKVIHRDIKAENILYTPSGDIKIIDFGTSKYISFRPSLKSIEGSSLYLAPEVLSHIIYYYLKKLLNLL